MYLRDEQKLLLKKRTPFFIVSFLAILTTYFTLWAWIKVLSLVVSNYRGVEIFYLPFLFGRAEGVHFLWILLIAAISIFGWLLSTRVKKFKTPRMRLLLFLNMLLANMGVLSGYGMTKVQHHVLPFFYERVDRVIDTSDTVNQALFEQTSGFFFMLVMLPLILVMFMGMFVITRYRMHDADLRAAFFEFQWNGERLRKFEEMGTVEEEITQLPDIELGINKKTKEMVVLPGKDRTLNTLIVGSIGTGKSAALGLPTILQDLHYITKFMNDFPKISQMENYLTEEIQGRYLNGLSVIEPSNDLCQKVYKLAKAHGIPDEAITYIDVTNPNTPSINVMQGPTEKVAEVFAQVISGLADESVGNDFFAQAQRNHLKQFIYLLKMHDPNKDVTFDMLLDMYNDSNRVHDMHVQLKKRFPEGYENITDRDTYNYWQILKGIDEWFDNVIVPKEVRVGGGGVAKARDDDGNMIYEDTQKEYVQGLRNILNDIGANPLIRRVLFGPSTFNFDDHMGSAGGLLLVNTAKGELEKLGSILGKIVLMTLQNASFRRDPNISTYHHIIVDEAPEYLYQNFASFPAQSRKYKVVVTILMQTLTQLRGAYGEDYMNTVVAAMRNRMVYADVSSYDAKYYSDMFGEKYVYQEGESEQSVSPLQDNPVTRSGSTYSKVREEALSASNVLFQDAFECAVKIVVNNKSIPVQQIRANFVPDEEFIQSELQVNQEVIPYWIDARFNKAKRNEELVEIADADEMEVALPPAYNEEEAVIQLVVEDNLLNLAQLEKATTLENPQKPVHEDVNYQKGKATPSLAAVTVPHVKVQEIKVATKSTFVEPTTTYEEKPSSVGLPALPKVNYTTEQKLDIKSPIEKPVNYQPKVKPQPVKAKAIDPFSTNEPNEVAPLTEIVLPKRKKQVPEEKQQETVVPLQEVELPIRPKRTTADDSEKPSESAVGKPKNRRQSLGVAVQPEELTSGYQEENIQNEVEDFYKEMKNL